MNELTNPIAELKIPDSGIIIKPEFAHKIKNTEKFYCPDHDCLDKNRILIVAKSKNNVYFFKHKANFKHEIRPQTLLHKLAVKWFENKSEFEIPNVTIDKFELKRQILKINSSKTELEYRKLKTIIPDVKLISEKGFKFAIEIFVTSDISEDKSKLINEFGLPTLRIDLSEFYKSNPDKCRIDYDFIIQNLDELLNDISIKSWEVYPLEENIDDKIDYEVIEQNKIDNEKEDNSGCIIATFIVALFLLFRKKK